MAEKGETRNPSTHRTPSQTRRRVDQERAYNNSPAQEAHRNERNRARRAYEKTHGDLPTNIEVDHKRSLKRGGSNDMSNLQAISRHANRSKQEGGRLTDRPGGKGKK